MSDEEEKVARLPVRFREPPPAERTLLLPYEVPKDGRCDHLFCQYIVNSKEADVECGRCGTKLNPMWVLGELANHDRRMDDQQKAAQAAAERLDQRRRTKCQHCKKMTRISLR
jgi:hypothetical protein